jgi:hypothetical protein
MMSVLSPVVVADNINNASLQMSIDEATDLLKYSIVNYCEIEANCAKSPLERSEDQSSMLVSMTALVEESNAEVNSLDREGNSLLTFITQCCEFDSISSGSPGINRLISCLLFHGIQMFLEESSGLVMHPAVISLSVLEREKLVSMFEEGSLRRKASQLVNYCVTLISMGRVEKAAVLIESGQVVLSSHQCSAIMRCCKFDSMERPVETFELLDKYGGQL